MNEIIYCIGSERDEGNHVFHLSHVCCLQYRVIRGGGGGPTFENSKIHSTNSYFKI